MARENKRLAGLGIHPRVSGTVGRDSRFIQSVSRPLMASICMLLLINCYLANGPAYAQISVSGSQLTLTTDPSGAVIKVGDKAGFNLTVTGAPEGGTVCFGQQGFPSSGFILTFLPQCAAVQQGLASGQLIVEVTPASAPQNFTALILATIGNETISAPLTITVVPAIPPWIPWLGILVFFIVIGTALFVRPKRSKEGKGKMVE